MAKPNSDVNVSMEHAYQYRARTRQVSLSYLFIKRLIDIVGALVALVIASPLFLILSTLYLFEKPRGNVLYTQYRYGKNGKKFGIYKFRSMVMNAEEKLKADSALYQKYLKNNYKLEPHEDPRITKLGQFLRKTSLDEIPQLINVLKGEMSLVGPRPIVNEELDEYGPRKVEFLSVKPGMTGYWQVQGRSTLSYPDRCDIELYYVYNQSIWLDIKILFKTVHVVLWKKGAY